MASFAEIMQSMQPQQSQVPEMPMPYVPGMPSSNVLPPVPEPTPMQAPEQQATPAAAPVPAGVPPEELAQRQAGWKTILDGFMKQPNAQQIMMTVGLKLLQGRKPGQSMGQQFGAAIGTGVAANAMLNENAKADAETQRKRGMEDQKFAVEQRGRVAEAGKAEYDLDFAKKTEPEKRQKIEVELGNLRRDGRLAEARAAGIELENGNFDAAWALTQRKANAEIANSAYNARTNRIAATKPTGVTAQSDAMAARIRRANPIQAGETTAAYDQRLAQLELDTGLTSKTNSPKELLAQAKLYTDMAEAADTAEEAAGYTAQALELTRQATAGATRSAGGAMGSGKTAPAFNTLADAIAAKKKGTIKPGESITIGGRSAIVD